MSKLLDEMAAYGADIEGVLDRFMEDEELYASCLKDFVDTTDTSVLSNQITTGDYEAAFETAHALKGVSGNLGLTPLFDVACVLVEALRHNNYENLDKQYADVDEKMQEFLKTYNNI